VSREGDLWRWDGFAVAALAPTGAARRLAGRNRLADIEAELRIVRTDLDLRRQTVAMAEAEVAATREAENAARNRWRAAQHEADGTRDRHAAAERELNRITSRRSALAEAQARVTTTLTETQEARTAAALALEGLAPSAALEAELTDTRTVVAADRGRLAEARAEAQALAREIELAERRLAAIASDAAAWTKRKEGAADRHHRSAPSRDQGRACRPRRYAGAVRRQASRPDHRNRDRADGAAHRC
jgi:chromosome segregation protein